MPVLTFSKWSPGGNTTLLFPDSGQRPAEQARLAALALDPAMLGGEQAGFVQLAQGKLRMAGGEFCVNASRAVGAMLAYAAAARLAPQIVEILFWNAVSLANVGSLEEALPIFKKVFASEPNWREMLARLVEPGLIKNDPEMLDKILKV